MRIRLTRNLDKDRGFVNGAIGVVTDILKPDEVFVLRLLAHDQLVLVHPVFREGHTFLPCAYGYATTIRRAQGMTVPRVVLWFDHKYAPDRGYAYTGASRVTTADELYHFGKIDETDWQAVNEGPESLPLLQRPADTEEDEEAMLDEVENANEGEYDGEGAGITFDNEEADLGPPMAMLADFAALTEEMPERTRDEAERQGTADEEADLGPSEALQAELEGFG